MPARPQEESMCVYTCVYIYMRIKKVFVIFREKNVFKGLTP